MFLDLSVLFSLFKCHHDAECPNFTSSLHLRAKSIWSSWKLRNKKKKKYISGDISRHLCVCIGVVAIRQEDKGRVDGSEADGCVVIKHTELRQ